MRRTTLATLDAGRRFGIAVATFLCLGSTVGAQAAPCESPVLEVELFSATLSPDGSSSVVLSFDDPNPAIAVSGYNIYRSANPSLPLSSWTPMAVDVGDENPAEPGVQWTDVSGETPATGIWFYLATAFNAPCTEEGPWKSLRVSSSADSADLLPGDGACLSEDGGCTLRAAIQEANALDGLETIVLGTDVYVVALGEAGEDGSASGDFDLTASVILRGQGATNTLIDALGFDRVLHVLPGVRAWVEGLTLQGGSADRGGALLVESMADVTLSAVVVNDNHSAGDGGGIAVDVAAQLTLEHSTVSYNVADGNGGGLIADGFVTIENSTFGWNAAGGVGDGSGAAGSEGFEITDGGALFVGPDAAVSLLHVTLSDNRATLGGAVANMGSVEMRNTIVADSPEGSNCDGFIDSLGNNLSSDSSCGFFAPGDLQDIDPNLGPLRVYSGGGTGTYPPLEDSPVIEAGQDCSSVDQVYAERPNCSIGATEFDPALFLLPSGLLYVGGHPRDGDFVGANVQIVDAGSNQIVGHLLLADIHQIVAHKDGRRFYMLQAANFTTPTAQDGLIVYDAVQNTATGIVFGSDLRDIALTPAGGAVVVTDAANRELLMFSTSTNQQIAATPLDWTPDGVDVHPYGYKAYVTMVGANQVHVVHLNTGTVVGQFVSGPRPLDVAFHPDGSRAYVLNHLGVSVLVVNGFTDQVITTIPLKAPSMISDHFGALAVHPNGQFVYVADGRLSGTVEIISTTSDLHVDTIFAWGRRVAVHPLGSRIYVAECGGGLTVISSPGHAIVGQPSIPGACGIAVRP